MKNNMGEQIGRKWMEGEKGQSSAEASAPRILMLEVTNACNLKCRMCQNRNMERAKGVMPFELAIKAIDQAVDMGVSEVALFATGEPLLYARLPDLVAEIKKRGLYCYVTSNGLLLDEKLAEALCRNGLDSFKFSIDASDKEEYERIRVGGDFEKLLENVRLLHDTSNRLESSLRIICASIMADDSQELRSKFRAIFEPLCDSVLFSEMSNLGGKVDGVDAVDGTGVRAIKPPCRLLWDRIVVCYDGRITACCVDFDAELCYSDLDETLLKDAWNGDTMRKWRDYHLTGKTDLMPMCADCNYPFISEPDRIRRLNE